MSIKRILVSFDVPDNYDNCWDVDDTGLQAFHDIVYNFIMGYMPDYLGRILELEKGSKEDKWLAEHLRIKYEALKTLKYTKEENE